ncbi:BLUE COPPER PROTEIN [Salix viminalis]|uniref:BLUE COPPER PROTEIN n=1 Tax=Salix viminalis TaxID=40686 RepID=A0A9Q0NNK5_SALVM|nr:BLUE COPPER PROTEIN [Salix viminalis]
MARGYSMALLAAISVAYLMHSSSAQTTYTVGDTTGWTVPQNAGRKMLVDPAEIAGPGAGEAAETAGGAEKAAPDAAKAAEEAAKQVAEGAANAPPAKNSATSLGFAGLTTFLSIFVALCY